MEDARPITDALVIAGGTDPHWDDSTRNFIEGVIPHVATYSGYEGRRDLVTVRHFLMNGTSISDGTQDAHGMAGHQVKILHNVELYAEVEDDADPQAVLIR